MTAVQDPLARAATLLEALHQRVDRSGPEQWLTLYARDKVECTLTYRELWDGAGAWAARLAESGVRPGDRVLLVLPTERAFYESYWGILLAGAVPVPAYPPVRLARIEEYLQSLARLAENSGARVLVTNGTIRPLLRPLGGILGREVAFLAADVAVRVAAVAVPDVGAGALALLQYTSGSTGAQKGVMLTHRNLLANLRAIGTALELRPEDVAVSWLPLYHDMGLIGLMMGSLYWGVSLVALSPVDFLRRPIRWLRLISEHRATLSAGPNFAYSLVARKAREDDLATLDLSTWRLALCGAEPIHPRTVDLFTERFEACGFRPEAFFAAYGLAENTLAVTFSDLGERPHLEDVDPRVLEEEGRAVRPARGEEARSLVSVGRPIGTVQLQIWDEEKRPVGERVLGEVVVRGPSVMEGYLERPDATGEALRGGWLHTGDLGFLVEGRLYISGRKKDMVIKAGRNYFAEDLEAAAGSVQGVRPGGVCIFSAENAERGTEEVVLVAEAREGADPEKLTEELRRRVTEATECRPDRVVVVPPRTLPKTSSGKIQRFKAREWYLDGSLASRGGERTVSGLGAYVKAWVRDKLSRFLG